MKNALLAMAMVLFASAGAKAQLKTHGSAGGLPFVPGASAVSSTNPGVAQPPEKTDFEILRGQVATVPTLLRRCCASAQGQALQSFCADHGPGSNARKWDLAAVLERPVPLLAAFLSDRTALEAALVAFQAALAAEPAPRAPEAKAARESDQKALEAALGREKSAGNIATAAAGALGVTDVDALLDKLFSGLALALRERAEQEAVEFVLHEVQESMCKQAGSGLQARDLLRNTCLLAEKEAFGGAVAPGGLASLEVLRRALREDLLSAPAVLLQKAVEAGYEPVLGGVVAKAEVAQAVGLATDAAVRGAPPLRALAQLSTALLVASAKPPVDSKEQRVLGGAAMAADAPGALARTFDMVRAATAHQQGYSARERGTVVLLLVVLRPAFKPVRVLLKNPLEQPEQRIRFFLEAEARASGAGDLLAGTGEDLLQALATSRAAPAAVADAAGRALLASAGALEKAGTDAAREEAAKLRKAAADSANAAGVAQAGAQAAGQLLVAVDAAADLVESVLSLLDEEQAKPAQEALAQVRLQLTRARDIERLVAAGLVLDINSLFQEAARHFGASCRAGFACIEVSDSLVRWSGLTVALAQARDPAQVKEVLLSAAAPVGSWRLKYGSASRGAWPPVVTLDGLVGFRSIGAPGDRAGSYDPGLSASFGVDVAFPLPTKIVHVAAFVQVLDLGAYLDFGGAGHERPRVLQAVSPGLLLRFGLFNSPFSLAGGLAWDVDAGGRSPADGSRPPGRTRWTFLLGLDVPLFVLSR